MIDPDRDRLNELLAHLARTAAPGPVGGADSGEAGLVPVAECVSFAAVQCWQRYPRLVREITDVVGAGGVAELAALSRREVGTKADPAHVWATGLAPALGRGVLMALGRLAGHEREDDLAVALGFMCRLHDGVATGPGGPSGDPVPRLDRDWVTRLLDESRRLDGGPARERVRRFATAAARSAGLLHFGSRAAGPESGPYPLDPGRPGRGYLVVREYFLHDEAYHWADLAAGLPHAVTLALLVAPGDPGEMRPTGTGRLRPDPLDRAAAVTAYARDRWDTPVSGIRRLDDTGLAELAARCREAADRLAGRVAAMSRRDRVMAGGQVRYVEPLLPFARAAGVWPRLRDELDALEWDSVASEVYYPLVTGGAAAELLPRLLGTGAGFPPARDAISAAEAFPALHLLALRGRCAELPVDPGELVSAGLVTVADGGYVLTEAGRGAHARELSRERGTYETARLEQAYELFVAQEEPLRRLLARWGTVDDGTDEGIRRALLDDAADIVSHARVALRRTNEQLLRFEGYLPRLRRALARVREGEPRFLAGPEVDSLVVVWAEVREDYRLTRLG